MRSISLVQTLRVGLPILLLATSARIAAAQQPANCTYTSCALRVHYSGLGDARVVQGETQVYADGGGVWSHQIPALEVSTGQTHHHYVEYRSHAKRSGLLALLGAAALGGGMAVDYDGPDGHKGLKISLISGGIIMGLLSSINDSRAQDHLQQAIWLYNRDLPR